MDNDTIDTLTRIIRAAELALATYDDPTLSAVALDRAMAELRDALGWPAPAPR